MRHCLIIVNLCRYLAVIFPVKVTEHILIAFFTGTEDNDLNRILAKLIHDVSDQIESFLICQAGYDTDHHGLWILLKSEIFLKLDLILDLFLAEILRIVVSGDVWICLRIEFIVINTIYNTSQAVGPCIEKTIQLFTVEWCFDLLCVSITYCGDRICKYYTALQEVGILIRLQFIRCKIVIRKPCNILNSLNIPYTLEFQVMYCHNSLDSTEEFILLERIMKVNRNKSCLPVMTVNDIRSESDHRKN